MNLASLERAFFRAVRRELAESELTELFAGTSRLSPAACMGIYASAHEVRKKAALAELYPRTARAFGARFAPLAATYVREFSSTEAALEWYGKGLPAFLRQQGEPGAADLAELEWARARCLLSAPDVNLLTEKTLPELSAERPLYLKASAELRRTTNSALALFNLDVPGAAAGPPDLEEQGSLLLFFRLGFRVHHRRPAPLEADLLTRLAAGSCLTELSECCASDSEPARALYQAFSRLVLDQLLTFERPRSRT